MRILYYSPHPLLNIASSAGYGTHMREMVAAFKEDGHEVELLIMGGTEPGSEPKLNVSTSKLKSWLKNFIPAGLWETIKDIRLMIFDYKIEKELSAVIDQFKPDLVYERCNYIQVSGVKVSKRKGITHILEVNAPYVEERINLSGRSWLSTLAKRRERELLWNTNKIVVVSTALKSSFKKAYNLPEDRFLVTPNAIDIKRIEISADRAASLHCKHELKGYFVFGFVGSIFPWHGVDILLKAFAKLRAGRPDVKLLVVGDGQVLSTLKKTTEDLNIKELVIFTGSIPHQDVFDHISIMDVAVMAKSNWYGSPVKIFEYGALGKPIIAPDNVPVNDVMVNNADGILIKPTEEEVYNAMKWMYENREKAKQMGETFRAKVISSHLWKHNSRKVIEVAGKIINNGLKDIS